MKANELRIGNWYMYADNDGIVYRTIKEIKHNEFGFIGDYDGVNFGICKPIPLTEELLLKFGFETTQWDNFDSYRLEIGNNDYVIVIYSDGNCEVGDIITTKINYVHQLQNLYFALTGEELTFKSE